MTVPRAIELIAEIAPTLPDDFLLGAGTVVDADTAHRAARAGAQFLVSPVFRPEVITAAHEDGIPAMPGCFTPTEILSAWDAGADVVKVFPATSVGPSYLKDIRGPLPHVKLMPTGGVSIDNIGDWLTSRRGRGRDRVGAARCEGDLGETIQRHRRQRAAHRCTTFAPRREYTVNGKGRHLRRDHAPAEPAGIRALPSVAGSVATFGGGEANAAVSLAQFGLDSYYVTRLAET